MGGLAVWWWIRRRQRPAPAGTVAVDFQHVLDLVRRVHGASAACLIVEDESSEVAAGDPRPDPTVIERAVATARLAMGDGRDHLVQSAPEIVAVGDGRVGAALVLPSREPSPGSVERVTADLRRLVAGFRVHVGSGELVRGDPQRALDRALTRLESVEGLSVALCEAAREIADRPTALVLRDEITSGAHVVALSRSSDQRLVGARVSSNSAAGRALISAVPVVGLTLEELVGNIPGDRRRRNEAGIAFPLHDGRHGIGALVVFGQPDRIETSVKDRIAMLARELTPHIGAAAAVRAAEARARTDELTGLPNRRALDRVLSQAGDAAAALLIVDLDHFKTVNDGFGHAAGDAALRHVAQIFVRTLRDGDLACRIGGEEFALWLGGAPPSVAHDVAERVRKSTADSILTWAGAELRLTCSIGVACFPDPIGDLANLRTAADAALYRAKEGGRNRVERATR